jgi:predicted ATPase with chaperone activity
MRLGEVLVLRGVASVDDIAAALGRQRSVGGRLGENLVALGATSAEAIAEVVERTPPMPHSVAETGIPRGNLLNLLLKFMRTESCELLSDLCGRMKLAHAVAQELVDEAISQRLVHVLGSVTIGIVQHVRYALSDQGRTDATAAMAQNQYLGPAPVSLSAFQAQVLRQTIKHESLDAEIFRRGFGGLIVNDQYMRKLLPAANSGQTVLLYGPPGNGKTSIGRLMAGLFRQPVHIPYALEVDGQIIKIYDESLHCPFIDGAAGSLADLRTTSARGGLQTEGFDPRWVICKRPVAMAGGELTLDMLDLRFDAEAKTYDAPLHMKALNGVFLIDDFGRQKVAPTDLLNRWIVPLESRIDYLKLKTGKSFSIPFDEMVIFSTNLEPSDLMDPAFLRRIPYKIHMAGPDLQEYRRAFEQVAASRGLSFDEEVFDLIVKRITDGRANGLAYYQPKFICDQVLQVCRCFDLPLVMTSELVSEALANLYVNVRH